MEHYLVAIGVTAGIYALMALGMNVIWGMAGLINLGLVGFFAVGAYVSGLLTLKLGLPIVVGMGLAGLGGMLIGLDTTIDPLTGFRSILSVFAAAVVGGLGSIPGAVVGALTVGIGEELCLLFLSPDYRSVVGFVAILLVLTLRPRGILGARAY